MLLPDASPATPPPAKLLWQDWIRPEILSAQVLNTAPFLAQRFPGTPEPGASLLDLGIGHGTEGFLAILGNWRNLLRDGLTPEEQLEGYFALCLACHHATVATFVPTDVDSKIRGLLWRETRDPQVLRRMLSLALHAQSQWTENGISTRRIRAVSGHNGEHWSVIAGALGRLLDVGDTEAADQARTAIEDEIAREQAIFDQTARERGAELDLLLVAMSIAHNRGDLTQGISFWRKTPVTEPVNVRLTDLGRFPLVVKMYQDTGMSAEGHRHYPLRPIKPLRESPETLLPLPPLLDDWGATVARRLPDHRPEILEALVQGCRKVVGQQGYYRAIAGMREADPRGFEAAVRAMPSGTQREFKEAETRKKVDLPRASFESMMRKRARASLPPSRQ